MIKEENIGVDGTIYGVERILVPEICTISKGKGININNFKTRKFDVKMNDHELREERINDFYGEFGSEPISHNIMRSKTEVKELSLLDSEEEQVIKNYYELINPNLDNKEENYTFNPNDPWIETYSGRRFTPTNPNPDAIVIQDLAHPLSMQCRFAGHCKVFYSVAQHCVLVSYLCNREDALWGLLHDTSEAYLVDLPRPLKHSGKFDMYKEYEKKVQAAICKRFKLPEQEPASVKEADTLLLMTEKRDILQSTRSDWEMSCGPLPFKIEALSQQDAKNLFMKRFFELTKMPGAYEHYLSYELKK